MKNLKKKKNNPIIENYIITVIFFFILFYQSVKVLLQIFSYGMYKNQILTNKSGLGFDLKIKMK